MDQLNKKLIQLLKALNSWESVLLWDYSDVVRDATIQRYEFSFELLWKALKLYLKEHDGIECSSPKSCFREARVALKLTEKDVELCLEMTDDRNLSVHTYSEKMAKQLYEKTKKYFVVSKKLAEKMSESTGL